MNDVNSGGRPERDPGYKTVSQSFSMSERELAEFLECAKRYNMGASPFVRFLFNFWKERITGMEPKNGG